MAAAKKGNTANTRNQSKPGKTKRATAATKGKKGSGKTVAAYVASLEPERRKQFSQLRELLGKQLPSAVETMAYSMPTWEINGEVVWAAASQVQYLALYSLEASVLDGYRDEFSHLNVGKCCIRFNSMDDLPIPIVKKMLRESERLRAK